jgi:hypothetical protein
MYYFESGCLVDDANRLSTRKGLGHQKTHLSKSKKNLKSTPGFRLLIDPFNIDPTTREPTFGYWPEDIFDFTLNNKYIIFKAKYRLWNISFEELFDPQ